MSFWQFLNNNLWTLVFISVFFGGSIIRTIREIARPFLKHHLEIEEERSKQAKADKKIAELEIELARVMNP